MPKTTKTKKTETKESSGKKPAFGSPEWQAKYGKKSKKKK